jgi:hypothetical protein
LFVWIFFFLVIVVAIIGMGIMRERGPGRKRLGPDGWPRPFSRAGHRRKEEE